MSGLTHLFLSSVDFGFKRAATLCGVKRDRCDFAQGESEATCPICRGLADELPAEQVARARRYRNSVFAGFNAIAGAA